MQMKFWRYLILFISVETHSIPNLVMMIQKIQSRERELISLCKELGKSNDMEARDALFSKMTYLQYQNTLNKEVAELR